MDIKVCTKYQIKETCVLLIESFQKNKIPIHVRGKTLTAVIAPNGYPVVALWKDNRGKTVYIHRLVAETFIPNPHDYPIINHKDENKANNCVENLEWCNMLYNNNYAARNQRLSLSLKNNNKLSKRLFNILLTINL